MSRSPRRMTDPVRLIVSVERELVDAVDTMMAQGAHHRHRNRAELVRQAIERELARCQSDDFVTSTRARDRHTLMISTVHKRR